MSKVYVVNKIEYQYNDEVYYNENDNGRPLKVFNTKEAAVAEKRRRTLADLQRNPDFLESYGYSMDEIVNVSAFQDLLGNDSVQHGDSIYDFNWVATLNGFTEDQWNTFVDKVLAINFYTVTEVEYEE